MILWLASYPRSGNTMLRILLDQAFGLKSYSKHNDVMDIGSDPKMIALVGHKFLENDWNSEYCRMKESNQLYPVKTHDPPEDDSKTIYMVRDGRAATVSFLHYLKDYKGYQYSLTELILGFHPMGSWSDHLDAWNPLNREKTLIVKYEQFLSRPQQEIERLGDFMGQKQARPWHNDFEHYHRVNPKFFRAGDTLKNIREIADNDLEIFWLFHTDWMDALGYPCDGSVVTSDAHALRAAVGKAYNKTRTNNSALKAERKKLRRKIEALRSETNRLNHEIVQMQQTLSWQLTAPIRNSNLLKNLRARLGKKIDG